VRVIYYEASGSYGRMSTDDGAEDAVLMSRAVGAPVRVQWSRQDEHGWEPKGPAQLDEMQAAIDAEGKLIAWDFTDYGQPWTASGATLLLASLQVGMKPSNPGQSNGTQGGGEITPCRIKRSSPKILTGISRNRFRCAPATCALRATPRAASPANVSWMKLLPI